MRVLSLFSGIGAFEVALDELGIEWELDHYCEIDKYASKSYNCIHGTTDEDDLTDNFYKRYMKIHGLVSEDFFIDYIENLPIKKNKIYTKKMCLYDFNEMDTITLIDGLSGTLTCRNVQNYNKKYLYRGRLYKPSPRMCFRMMGFKDKYFDKIKGLPDKELYKQAGNSIVVSVIEDIFESLAVQYPSDFVQTWGDDL